MRCLPFVLVLMCLSWNMGASYMWSDGPRRSTLDAVQRALDLGRVEFETWNSTVAYSSEAKFYSLGMAPLYNGTHVVLDAVIGEKALPDGFMKVENGRFVVADISSQWGTLAKHYVALIIIVLVGLLLAIVVPVVGFCFCCCRCAGACGARSEPFDKKHDTCRRVILGLFLIIVATGMLFGVVVAFVTNSYMQEGIESTPDVARVGVTDSITFFTDSSQHLHHLLVTNYIQLKNALVKVLNESPEIVSTELAKITKAISLEKIYSIVNGLEPLQRNLIDMKMATNDLRVNASQLNDGLRRVKRELLTSLNSCNQEPCREVLREYKIGELDTSGIDFNQLPDPTDLLIELDSLLSGNLVNNVKEGVKEFEGLQTKMRDYMEQNIPQVTKSLNDAGTLIEDNSNKIQKSLDDIVQHIQGESDTYINTGERYIKQYSVYRYYVGLGVSCILLLVLVCVTFGLFCGICGKRPDGYGDDCCNKGSGSTFFMFAVAVMFLTTLFLAIIALAYFVVGLAVRRGVCIPLRDPANDQLFHLLDDMIDLDVPHHPFVVSEVIIECHKNSSIYEVMKLENVFNINDVLTYIDKFEISEKLDSLTGGFTMPNDIKLLSPEAKSELITLANGQLNDFKFYQFADTLSSNITSINLTSLAEKLHDTAARIPANPIYDEIRINLKNQALHLDSYQHNLVTPMVEKSKELVIMANDLEVSLKFNETSFKAAVENMIAETEEAQTKLNNEGGEFLGELAREFSSGFEAHITSYLTTAVREIHTNVGRCGPLSNVYNATLMTVCNQVLDPFNGFWAGLGWCVLLFIPCIVLSVKLSGLYQKSDPYPGPLVESAPPSKRGRKGGKERNAPRTELPQQPLAHEGIASASSQDDRYTDMAPKHWDDYPEGAPPRYHSPPLPPLSSEYERPPPYYYPGPTTKLLSVKTSEEEN